MHKICLIHFCRQQLWFTGTTFHGYEDIGDGPGIKAATHFMMIMATALNMSWKLPVAYFLIPDGFSAEKREELLRTCVYHLNNTGAILTSIVMDNCPVNYATFRKLGCNLSRKFCDLNPATDMKNVSGKYVMALFDPPHLSKLGICFIVQVSHQTYSDAEFFECCVLLKITGAQPWPRINRLKFFQIWF